MLEELEIRNLGPIRSATLTPASGMTAITGETGAGKSMLLNAVRLVSGAAADARRVSADVDAAWAQAVFAVDANDRACDEAAEAGAEPEDGELFLTRIVPAKGRSRAMLNGRGVPRSVLERVCESLIVIHGQADQLRIASPAKQREFLDMAAGDREQLDTYRQAWNALAAIDERLERLTSQEAELRQRADYLRESIERIDRVDPHSGEDEDLKARRSRIENAADIVRGVGEALTALDSGQMNDPEAVGACDLVLRASQRLRAIHVDGVFPQLADRLDSIHADLSDVAFSLSRELDVDSDVEDLDALNGRIHELDELTRRWGPTLDDVIAWRDRAVLEMEDLDASPEAVDELRQERGRAFAEAMAAADALSAVRRQVADELSARVGEELSSLAMSGASLEIRVASRSEDDTKGGTWPLDANGRDDIAFLFTSFPGSPQLPMGKSASGGELSRLMLALELVSAERRMAHDDETTPSMTFIFDEVDAGVGGRAAAELGRRLAALARDAQVIVVTHLAQVASWADSQFVVSKGDAGDGVISTGVCEVTGEARVREIARMLAGGESESSLTHARELLSESRLR